MLFSFIWSQPNPSIAAGRDYSPLYVCSQTPASWLWYFLYCVCSGLEFHTVSVHHTVTAKDCMEDDEIERQVVCYSDSNCCTQDESFFQWSSGDKFQQSSTCEWGYHPLCIFMLYFSEFILVVEETISVYARLLMDRVQSLTSLILKCF
jgi:hypothetical protein